MSEDTLQEIRNAVQDSLPKPGSDGIVAPIEKYLAHARHAIRHVVDNHPNPLQILMENPDLVSRDDMNHLVGLALIRATAPSVHEAHRNQYAGREYEIVRDIIISVQAEALDLGEIDEMLSDYLEDPTSSDIGSIMSDLHHAACELSLSSNRKTGALINQITELFNHVSKDPASFQANVIRQHQEQAAPKL